MKPIRGTLVALAISGSSLALLAAGGCGGEQRIDADYVRRNPSPELQSIALTKDQRENTYAKVFDVGFRQILDDWDRVWMLERPSRMSPYPTPGGQ